MLYNNYDVIIVGAGVAGLYVALNLDKRFKVLLLAKKSVNISNTALAQGGIAAVTDKERDDNEIHINDTLIAGKHKNNRRNLRIMVEEGAQDIETLVRFGVNFDRNPDGTLSLGLEGGHSRSRIIHHKDSTGNEIVTALAKKVKCFDNIDFLENAHLLQLTQQSNRFYANIFVDNEHRYYAANAAVIATGGIGGVYNYTTNSEISTGDGIYFAHRLNANIKGMSLIQFHPTAVPALPPTLNADSDNNRVMLITEAARGEGALLYNKNKRRFTDELAPRDIISNSIIAEEKRLNSNEFYLDISHRKPDFVKSRFPMVYEKLLKNGYDLTKEPVPVYPCQHYLMGGIEVDSAGKTNINGLYAVGECAFTGVHGDNRLASNSLLEALVFGRLAAVDINSALQHKTTHRNECSEPPFLGDTGSTQLTSEAFRKLRAEIRDIMQSAFFVALNYEQAQKGLARISEIRDFLASENFELTPESVEINSLATVAYLILEEFQVI